MGNYVFGTYTDSEGPDHTVNSAVWLQHSLSAYSILDTQQAHNVKNDVVSTSMRRDHVVSTLIRRHFDVVCLLGSIYIVKHKPLSLRLCCFIADLDHYCSYVPRGHLFLVRTVFYPKYLDCQTCPNSVDPDQTPPNASHLAVFKHCN